MVVVGGAVGSTVELVLQMEENTPKATDCLVVVAGVRVGGSGALGCEGNASSGGATGMFALLQLLHWQCARVGGEVSVVCLW